MKILSKNITPSQTFKFHEWPWIFCILLLSISTLLGNNSLKPEKQRINSYGYKVNQHNTHNKFIQSSRPIHQFNPLLVLELLEESETNDENTEDDIVESCFQLRASISFDYTILESSFLESSFANFNLSLQKRTAIPLFLLHHSWRIPSV